jgi:hypothetical protein
LLSRVSGLQMQHIKRTNQSTPLFKIRHSIPQIIEQSMNSQDHIYIDKKVNVIWWERKILLPSTAVGQYSDNYDATMRSMRQTHIIILATTVAVCLSVLQPATILTYGSVN